MVDLNKVMLIGRVGATQSLGTCFRMQVATKHSKQADDSWSLETCWHSVTAYGALAQKCAEHLTPGILVYVEGSLLSDGNGGTVVEAKDIHFLKAGGKSTKEVPNG